jgi:DNA-binding transcriptional LysR family regulator
MRINFDFNDLDAFLAVMETNSFHHAAERLNLSQSAVTRRIQKLEEALGSALFDRTTRAVRPTLAAKRLQSRAEAMLEGAQETTLAMRDESMAFAHQRNAVVTLAMIPTVVAALLPQAIQRFRNEGFNARIRLLDFAANEVAEAVSQGEADFGVCSIESLEPNTHFEALFDDQIVVALPSHHALAGSDEVNWSDLQSLELILPARGTGNRLLIDEAMARSRTTTHWTYEVNRSTTAMELVNRGTAVALLPRSVMNSTHSGGLVFKGFANPTISRPIGLLTRSGTSDTPAVKALKEAIKLRSSEIAFGFETEPYGDN